MANDVDNFDWSSDWREVVLAEQCETAVYTNPYGEIVIRQRDGLGNEAIVRVLRGNADALAHAIMDESDRPFEWPDDDIAEARDGDDLRHDQEDPPVNGAAQPKLLPPSDDMLPLEAAIAASPSKAQEQN